MAVNTATKPLKRHKNKCRLRETQLELEEFQASSRDLETELETQLSQLEHSNRELKTVVGKLQSENEGLQVSYCAVRSSTKTKQECAPSSIWYRHSNKGWSWLHIVLVSMSPHFLLLPCFHHLESSPFYFRYHWLLCLLTDSFMTSSRITRDSWEHVRLCGAIH